MKLKPILAAALLGTMLLPFAGAAEWLGKSAKYGARTTVTISGNQITIRDQWQNGVSTLFIGKMDGNNLSGDYTLVGCCPQTVHRSGPFTGTISADGGAINIRAHVTYSLGSGSAPVEDFNFVRR